MLWNGFVFDTGTVNIVKNFRIVSFVLSFISAIFVWIMPVVIFHITALIISQKIIKLTPFLKVSALFLLIPLLAEACINIVFSLQNVSYSNSKELTELFELSPYVYFKYVIWISYIFYLMGLTYSIHNIYRLSILNSVIVIIFPIVFIVLISSLF